MQRLLGRFHVTGVFWYRFHQLGASVLPEWGLWAAILIFTSFFFVTLIKIRSAIGSNLEAVLGPCGWWRRQVRIYRTMWSFAWCLSERYERLSTDKQVQCEVDGDQIWNGLLTRDDGIIFVTAHIGGWEVGSMLASARQQVRRVHVVREKEVDPKAQEFIRGLIESAGEERYTVHFAGADDPTLGTQLLAALRHGDIVALQGDRPRTGGRTVTTTLFGRPFELPVGTAALARAAEVPMVPVFVLREGRSRSRILIRKPIYVERTRDRDQDLKNALTRLTAEIEAAIRLRPHQWFCFRRLWDPRAEA